MMREVVKISSKAIVIPFSLAILIPHFFQLTLMWLESPFRLPGCSKQELGQTQHQKAAEPAGGKIKPILQGNYWTLSASWRKCTGDFSMSAGAQMLGHMTKDMYLSELQPATTQYIHRLVLSWVSESTHFEKFIKHKTMALWCSQAPRPHTMSKGLGLFQQNNAQIPVMTLTCLFSSAAARLASSSLKGSHSLTTQVFWHLIYSL